ncbi:MAG TPA: immunoglobulin-like domain-containing protein [Pyrinomonadaceae bacterium]|jgi:uncharacterized repeat protein (TIGR01451 family)|nr:immunoglobulin-like domain-containing protein [Pyrinomonadaceae bacterium]
MKGRITPTLLRLVRTNPRRRLPQGAKSANHRAATIARAGTISILVVLLAVAINSGSAAKKLASENRAAGANPVKAKPKPESASPARALVRAASLLQSPPPDGGVITYDCSTHTLKSDFNLGETVCAKASGAPFGSLFPWHIVWVDPSGFIEHSVSASSDPDTEYQFTLPSSQTSTVNGVTVNNRGEWRVNLTRPNGAVRFTAFFSVHDPAQAVADLSIKKFIRDGDNTVPAGGSIVFVIVIANAGPDTAQGVHLVDSTPSGATLASFTQQSGPPCTPAGSNDCTIASLAGGERAEFTAIYSIDSGAAPGDALATGSVSSQTTELDNSDNTATTAFVITTTQGGSQCTLECPTSPAAVNNEPGTGGAHVTFDAPVAIGSSCGAVSTTSASGAFFPVGTTPVTASTESGESCTFTVTVNDVEKPAISCPNNISTFESSPGSGSATVNFNVTATDNSGSATITCDHQSGDSFNVGPPTTVTCTATDDASNSASCSFTVTVKTSTGACTLTPPAAPVVADSTAGSCGANVAFDVGTSGSCSAVTCDHASGSFFHVGDTAVTCTTEEGGVTNFTVTVNDKSAPVPDVATLPTITGECAVSVKTAPRATDDCGAHITGTTNDPTSYTTPDTYTVHWTYTDASGNISTQNQTVVVTPDTTPPVPDLAVLPTITGECTAAVTDTPTATDNCSGAGVAGTTTDPLTYTGAGTYTIHWTYTDPAGNSSHQNQTVVVTDTQPPTITLVGASSVTVECHTTFTDPGVTTDDNCLPKNVTVTTTGSLNVNAPGTYTITYTATDGGGNHVSVQRTVTVVDTTPPVLTLNGASSVTVECHTSFADPGATATDSCDTGVAVTVTGSVNVNVPGTYTLIYSAHDASGNAAPSVQRTVNVVDTTAPVITTNGHTPSMWPPNHKYQTFKVTDFVTGVTDSCNTSLGVSSVVIEKVTSDEIENGNGDGNTSNDIIIAADFKSVQLRSEREGGGDGRVYTITFRVCDASGNVGRATAKVVVQHNPGETPVDSGPHYTVNGKTTCP